VTWDFVPLAPEGWLSDINYARFDNTPSGRGLIFILSAKTGLRARETARRLWNRARCCTTERVSSAIAASSTQLGSRLVFGLISCSWFEFHVLQKYFPRLSEQGIEEGEEVTDEYKDLPALDTGRLAAARAVEQYEISRYAFCSLEEAHRGRLCQ
jgi:hypothetical protein